MITETGRVVAIKGNMAWVQTIRASACESCSARSGCGQRVLASASSGRANQVLVTNDLEASVGDEVTVAIDESALLSASLLVYALPLLLMVLGAVTGQQWLPAGDAGAIAGALSGLAAGFFLTRVIQSRPGKQYEPRLVRVLPSGGAIPGSARVPASR
ncbi:SoxR reducing system RseC family protein [Marinobacter confluentis]|uniref:Sigma E positive regulator RseC/MucC n=1 Tax=Marinobacter confluentis TaxID=1697557 RepID=A0A4Z1BEI2_9GAMM|nr:SoxR reducing system RseC family protein [Marinobacter confluentis]TGN41044.1 sigma E positive regulator RseC/MucC [Marinobacter confluentis]